MADHRSRSETSNDIAREKEGGLLGIGLDGKDGHHRVSSGGDFLIVGGSAETHERMQDLVIHLEATLKERGQTLRELDGDEFDELVIESFKASE
jgi:hypothetical protein